MELKVVKLSDVEIESRVRESMGDISSLVQSFKTEGMIQPIAIEEGEGGKYRLLAGGRRCEAARRAGIEDIPARIYEAGMNEMQRKSIELAENIYREDLTWQESVKLKDEIHTLQVEIHGTKDSTSIDAEGWSKRDTSRLLGESPTSTVVDIQLARAIELIPDLKKAQNRAEALKMLKKLGRDIALKEMAVRIEGDRATTPLEIRKQGLFNSYIIGDFLERISGVASGVIDLVELDPPFAIDIKNKKKSDDNLELGTAEYNEIEAKKYKPFIRKVLKECHRVMGSNSWLIIWFGPEPWFNMIYLELINAGFEGPMIPGIWRKPTGQTMQPGYRLANCYEMFFYARKGQPAIIKQGRSNIFEFKTVPSQRKSHPTEKPIELYMELLGTFGTDLSKVLVPFLGSGNTLMAASNLGMSAFGYDLGQEYKDRYVIKVAEGSPGSYRSY